MAITKTILKKVRQQAVVKFVGDGTANVDCNIDVRLSDETSRNYKYTKEIRCSTHLDRQDQPSIASSLASSCLPSVSALG
jgi:hypothetical protein